jgi:putative chitinase
MILQPSQLKFICPHIYKEARVFEITKLLNDICPRYKIDTADRLHEFIATLAHESQEFAKKEENLFYSATGLLKTFPHYFEKVSEASAYERDPIKIASKVYAGRMGNGDERSKEGYNYRGGGFIQITGKDIYVKYAKYLGKDPEVTADIVREDDHYAMDSACWLFAIEKKLLDEADEDDFITITKRINGGLNGLEDREQYLKRARLVIT